MSADLQSRVAKMQQTSVQRAAENRAAMPETAVLMDELREVFGKPRWFRVEENGRTVEWGKRS